MKSIESHYKNEPYNQYDLNSFLKEHDLKDEFDFGYYFHLWVDNYAMYLDIGDISKDDVLILDRKAILPIINHLKCKKFKDLKSDALNHILELESEVIPLYSVSKEKCKRYNDVLDHIVNAFLSEYNCLINEGNLE